MSKVSLIPPPLLMFPTPITRTGHIPCQLTILASEQAQTEGIRHSTAPDSWSDPIIAGDSGFRTVCNLGRLCPSQASAFSMIKQEWNKEHAMFFRELLMGLNAVMLTKR